MSNRISSPQASFAIVAKAREKSIFEISIIKMLSFI